MAKLYFRYGSVGSAKTLNLLAVAHSYNQKNKKVLLLKPEVDTRFGAANIRSRVGIERTADIVLSSNSDLMAIDLGSIHCLLVDEAQFLTARIINQLRKIATIKNVPVICYGLRTDFQTNLFPGSKRLMEIADAIEEIKNTCWHCNRKALFNLRFINGTAQFEGEVIDLGSEEKYLPICSHCYETLSENRNA